MGLLPALWASLCLRARPCALTGVFRVRVCVQVIQSYYKTDEAELKRDVRTYSLAFVGVGVGSVLVYTCEHFFFGAMVSRPGHPAACAHCRSVKDQDDMFTPEM